MTVWGTVYELERQKACGTDSQTLLVENARLREALRVIRDMAICEDGETAEERESIVGACREVAREALNPPQPE